MIHIYTHIYDLCLCFHEVRYFQKNEKELIKYRSQSSGNTGLFVWVGENISMSLGIIFILKNMYFLTYFTKNLEAMNTKKQWILLLTRLRFKRNILPSKSVQDFLENCWFQVWKKRMYKINLENVVVTEYGEIIKGNYMT